MGLELDSTIDDGVFAAARRVSVEMVIGEVLSLADKRLYTGLWNAKGRIAGIIH
jgi:hypothetical protein